MYCAPGGVQSRPDAAGCRVGNVRKDIETVAIRRFLIVFGSIVALAVAAHGALWWIVAGELQNGISAWGEERRAAGWTIGHSAPTIGGYPMRVLATIGDPDIAVPGTDPGDPARWRWQGTSLRIALQPWKPREISFSFAGRHRLHANHGERREIFVATVGSANGRAHLTSDGRVERILVDVGAVEASRPGAPERLRLGQLGLTLLMPEHSNEAVAKPEDEEPAGPIVSVTATNVVLPKEARYPLGRTVRRIAIDAKLIGGLAPVEAAGRVSRAVRCPCTAVCRKLGSPTSDLRRYTRSRMSETSSRRDWPERSALPNSRKRG